MQREDDDTCGRGRNGGLEEGRREEIVGEKIKSMENGEHRESKGKKGRKLKHLKGKEIED